MIHLARLKAIGLHLKKDMWNYYRSPTRSECENNQIDFQLDDLKPANVNSWQESNQFCVFVIGVKVQLHLQLTVELILDLGRSDSDNMYNVT